MDACRGVLAAAEDSEAEARMPVGTGGLSFPRLVCSINRPDLPRINASIFVAALICSAVGDMPIVEVRAARSGASGTGGLSFSLLASSFSRPDLPRITASILVAAFPA